MGDKDLFAKVINKFKCSNKRCYDFLVKAGPKYKDSCLKMCQRMFSEEVFPDSYKDTIHKMVYKGKGTKDKLPNNRFVHCKLWQPRLAEALLVVGGMKEPLVSCSSIYQVGGQAGYSPEELLFTLKSVLVRYHHLNKVLLCHCHDAAKFFDKEVATVTLDVLYRRGVDPKICRLWAKLNDTLIEVRTGVGKTQSAEIGFVIGQGTMGGALASQASLDDGIDGRFHRSQEELSYGLFPMSPLLFQDDILESSQGITEASAANICVERVLIEKRLS